MEEQEQKREEGQEDGVSDVAQYGCEILQNK